MEQALVLLACPGGGEVVFVQALVQDFGEPGVAVTDTERCRGTIISHGRQSDTAFRRPDGGRQETAALTSSATFCSTAGVHLCIANDTGHTSPAPGVGASRDSVGVHHMLY